MPTDRLRTPLWAIAFPVVAIVAVIGLAFTASTLDNGPAYLVIAIPAAATLLLLGCVFSALHHAEIVALRLGEPLGTLALTLSVTVIEVTIVGSMMLHGANNPTLAREAVFSVVMLVCTGLIGLCLLIGGLRFGGQDFQPRGTSAFLAVLMALSVLTLILPNYTTSTSGPTYSLAQLVFVSIISILLYAAFLFALTVRHRGDFIDVDSKRMKRDVHTMPSPTLVAVSGVSLIIALTGVVLLAKRVAAGIEDGLDHLALPRPDALSGAVIALLVLLPEGLTAVNAAARNALQTSLNVALGSAVATIGLTIPAMSVLSIVTGRELTIGLEPRDIILLVLTLGMTIISFSTGRTNMLTGSVHLVIFATYVFLLIVP
jgi:Ca2+:H+ antiporter